MSGHWTVFLSFCLPSVSLNTTSSAHRSSRHGEELRVKGIPSEWTLKSTTKLIPMHLKSPTGSFCGRLILSKTFATAAAAAPVSHRHPQVILESVLVLAEYGRDDGLVVLIRGWMAPESLCCSVGLRRWMAAETKCCKEWNGKEMEAH